MNRFSISDLARFSGIKPHTIRIWEQRYQAFSPDRTPGNTRNYDGADLKRLLNIVSLRDLGYKVAELCGMSDETLGELVSQLYSSGKSGHLEHFVSQLLYAGINFDEMSFDKILSHCLLRFGMEDTYTDIIYPLLDRAGLMWTAGALHPAQEHFISNLIRQKLITAIDSLPAPQTNSPKWLLFLPEDEYHEIGLIFAHFLLVRRGQKVVYLGSSVPLATLKDAVERIHPDCLLLFLVRRDFPESVIAYLKDLRGCFPKGKLFVSGNEKLLEQVSPAHNVQKLSSMYNLEEVLE